MGDLHAVVAILEPGHTEPVRIATAADPLPIAMQVGLLRAAAGHLAQLHGMNGADCLRAFLDTYPQPDTTEEGS